MFNSFPLSLSVILLVGCCGVIVNGSQQLISPTCLTYPCLSQGRCEFDLSSNQPICVCQQPFVGRFCEVNTYEMKAYPPPWMISGEPIANQGPVNNLCLFVPDVCKNGGRCYPIGPAGVPCICDWHWKKGTCKADKCECEEGWNGPRCDDKQQCTVGYCFNGGNCTRKEEKPYLSCVCPSGYKGKLCDEIVPKSGSIAPCEFKIRILNTGAYVARFVLLYYYNNVRQPLYVSNEVGTIGGVTEREILGIAQNLEVSLQVFIGFGWRTIHVDRNIGINKECIKCYKFWGTIFDPKWDHITC